MKSKKPTPLALESSTAPVQKDAVAVVPDMAARADGTCAVTRAQGVVVFSPTESGYADTYVETMGHNQEIALHATADRFVVWSKRFAVAFRKLEVVVFSRAADGSYARSVLWESREVGPFPSPLHPIVAGFVGDRVAVAMYVPGESEGRSELWTFAPTADGYERTETIALPTGLIATSDARWAIVHRRIENATRTVQWVARLLTFGDAVSASDAALPLDGGVTPESAAIGGSLLVLGSPALAPAGRTNEGGAWIYALAGDAFTLVKAVGPTKPKQYSGFGAMLSVCGERVAIASLGWERRPAGNKFVPRESVTSVFDARGELIAQGEPRTVSDPARTWKHTHTRLTRRHVLEMHGSDDSLKALRVPE